MKYCNINNKTDAIIIAGVKTEMLRTQTTLKDKHLLYGNSNRVHVHYFLQRKSLDCVIDGNNNTRKPTRENN